MTWSGSSICGSERSGSPGAAALRARPGRAGGVSSSSAAVAPLLGLRGGHRAGRVGGGHAGLVRAEPGVALLDLRRGRLRRRRAGRAPGRTGHDPQHVADLVERVDAERLEVEVVPERLHPGVALAGLVGGLVGSGRRPARGRGRSRIERLRSSIVWRNWRSGLPSSGANAARRRSSSISSRDSSMARVARVRRLAERADRAAASRARTARRRSGSAPARAPRAAGCAAWGSARRRCARARPSWARARRGSRAGGSSSGPAPRSARPGSRRCRRPRAPTSPASSLTARPPRDTVSASRMKSRMILFWPRRIASVCDELAQRRVRAADHLVELLGPPGEAGAELGEDQPEALAVGAAHHVVDQVGRDRRGRSARPGRARRRAAPRRPCRGRSR